MWDYTRVLSTAAGKAAKGGPGEGSNRRHMRERGGGGHALFSGGGGRAGEASRGVRGDGYNLSKGQLKASYTGSSRPHTLVA